MTEQEFFNANRECVRCHSRDWRVFRLPWMNKKNERELICQSCGYREDVMVADTLARA